MEDECEVLLNYKSSNIILSKKIRHVSFGLPTKEDKCDFIKLGFLRVFDVHYVVITKLLSSIGDLKHLRYLDLTCHGLIKQLTDSICRLWNLQTLDLGGCWSPKMLPENMKYLRTLRHLYLLGCLFHCLICPLKLGS